jgi:hypothetical protein
MKINFNIVLSSSTILQVSAKILYAFLPFPYELFPACHNLRCDKQKKRTDNKASCYVVISISHLFDPFFLLLSPNTRIVLGIFFCSTDNLYRKFINENPIL